MESEIFCETGSDRDAQREDDADVVRKPFRADTLGS